MVDSKTSGVVIKPAPAFVNEMGSITNIAFGEFRCVSWIHSMAGSFRSRHWHTNDSHVLYVVKGEMWYKERELDGRYPAEWTKVMPGESVYTPALVVHQSYFPRATDVISMSKRDRDHASHESDVNRVDEAWESVP